MLNYVFADFFFPNLILIYTLRIFTSQHQIKISAKDGWKSNWPKTYKKKKSKKKNHVKHENFYLNFLQMLLLLYFGTF